ncbi:TPA: putative Ig domain-containing protein, partial [Klebsiella aerogenes]|nr:putative Ig domain-containing protein [Klebsiella aerogenes]
AVITITVPAAHIKTATASIDNTTATVGTAYTGQLNVVCDESDDGSYTYAYSLNGTNYGLSISGTGAITGTPTAAGTAGFKVTVTDSYGAKQTGYANVVISAAPAYAQIQSVGAVTGYGTNPGHPKVGHSFTRQLTATPSPADDGSYAWRWYWNPTAPAGMTLTNADTAIVTWSGTPTVTDGGKTFYLYVDVTDYYGTTKTTTGAGGMAIDK